MSGTPPPGQDFIRQIVTRDVESGLHAGRILTRFPPEPNGYLHLGHAAAICLDFGIAEEYGGETTLRMDDTNPTTEDPRYVEAIAQDVAWLGFEWEGEIRYASDYFGALHDMAVRMIEDGFAYVDSLSEAEIREHRGTVTEPSRPSPYRERSVEDNLDLFRRMRAGEFEDGAHVLRAKIDLAAPNMKMRDPLMYRIRHAHHYRTGDEWPIYPMYDWAHGQSDAIEGITHSLCTLEFENNRELYDWFIEHTRPSAAGLDRIPGARGGGGDELGSWDPRPRQFEFARFNYEYTVVSKRKLLRLVEEGHVEGWDDPRMPTLAGQRRRGVPPAAIRTLVTQVGIAKADKRIDIGKLEYAIRSELNPRAPRVLCVLRPLRVVLENYPEDRVEELDAPYFPRDVAEPPAGWPASRKLPFARELFIDRRDFLEEPPEGYYRLAPGREVRLRHAYFITCREAVKDPETGEVVELRCTYDPDTKGGSAPDGRKVRGTIHWVSAEHSLPAEVRLYDRLFRIPDPEAGPEDFLENLNPDSLEVVTGARIEPSVADDPHDTHYQFERLGYFVRDTAAGADGGLVFDRTVTLRDTWAKRRDRKAPGRKRAAARSTARRETAPAPEAAATKAATTAPKTRGPTGEAAGERSPAARERFERFRGELGLDETDAEILAGEAAMAALLEDALAAGAPPGAIAKWIIHELRGATSDRSPDTLPFGGPELGELAALVESGEISHAAGKRVLARLIEEGGRPRAIVESEGLARVADPEALQPIVQRLIDGHPAEVERFRSGQEGLLKFFVGRAMRETKGSADPELLETLFRARLEA